MSCLHPFTLTIQNERGEFREVLVPCGKCLMCRKRKQSEWIFRMQVEKKVSYSTLFVTLTYDDEHIPLAGVQKTDCQNFIKRYRKHLEQWPDRHLKYFLCAEYGSRTHRPHYHIVLFYNWLIDLIPESCEIQRHWSKGAVKIGTCDSSAIAYVTKYMFKPQEDEIFENKTFTLMSRRPAIGIDYLYNGEVIRLHEERADFQVVSPDGYILNLPRYYRDKLFDDFSKWLNRCKLQEKFEKEAEFWDNLSLDDMKFKFDRLNLKQKQKNRKTDKI